MSPRTKELAQKRAVELKKYLDENTGAKWKTRVWHNLGQWHIAACCGTLSVYPHYYTACAPTYMVMNGATGVWVGHAQLNTFTGKSPKKLLIAIKASLNEHKRFIEKYVAGYNSNKKLVQFSKLQ